MKINIITAKELFRLIKENNKPQSGNNSTSELFMYANKLASNNNYNTTEKLNQVLIEFSDYLKDLSEEDIISFINFITIAKIQNRELFKAIENKYSEFKNTDHQAFILRLLSVIEKNSLSKSLIFENPDVSNTYPVFIAELLFDINPYYAVEFLKDKTFDFNDAFEIFERWVIELSNSKKYKDLFDEFLRLLDFKFLNQSIYDNWKKINNSYINRITNEGILNRNQLLSKYATFLESTNPN